MSEKLQLRSSLSTSANGFPPHDQTRGFLLGQANGVDSRSPDTQNAPADSEGFSSEQLARRLSRSISIESESSYQSITAPEREKVFKDLIENVYKLVDDTGKPLDLNTISTEDALQIWAQYQGRLTTLFLLTSDKKPLEQKTARQDQIVFVNFPTRRTNNRLSSFSEIFTLDDILPKEINYVEWQGKIYRRSPSNITNGGSKDAQLAQLSEDFLSGRLTEDELLSKKKNLSDVFVDVSEPEKVLPFFVGQQLRCISNFTYEQAQKIEGRDIQESLRKAVRDQNKDRFRRENAQTIARVEQSFPVLNSSHTEGILAIIARFNPDFDMSRIGGLGNLNEEKIAAVEPLLGVKYNPTILEHQLFVLYATYYNEVLQNVGVVEIAKAAQINHLKRPLADKSRDTETQVYAIFYLLITQTTPPSPITGVLFKEFESILVSRFGRLPTETEITEAYKNHALLEQLRSKGILTSEDEIVKDALITIDDFVRYVYDLVDELDIPNLQKNVPLNEQETKNQSSVRQALGTLNRLFPKKTTKIELPNGKLSVTTWCMQTVRGGLSKLLGIHLPGYGNMAEIFQSGLPQYAQNLQSIFQSTGKESKFLGYDPNFGKTHTTAPAGANLAMIFPDTTTMLKNGKTKGGHVAVAFKNKSGEWMVYDEYYQGSLGVLKSVAEYYSPANAQFWNAKMQKNPERIKGAIFFNGDISQLKTE